MHCCYCSSPWKSCLTDCCLDTDLHKRYLVTKVLNMWEVSMGGSHTLHYIYGCTEHANALNQNCTLI
jgi:hypothetical protein